MTKYFIFLFILAIQAHGEIGISSKPTVNKSTLPNCVSDPAEIQKIKDVIKANSTTANKYNGYREVFQGETDEMILARLAYAETVAANCPENNEKMLPLITNVIATRASKRNGDIKSVVFQRDQFASSMNIYDESKYLDFLCPKDQKLWSGAYNSAVVAMGSNLKNKDTVHYFLYKHSSRTKKPATWSFTEDASYTTPQVQSCIRFFHNAKWK